MTNVAQFQLEGGEGSFAAYRTMVGDVLDAERREGDDRPFRAHVTAFRTSDSFAHTGFHTAASYTRRMPRIRADGLVDMALMRMEAGEGAAVIAGAELRLAPGDVLFMDRTKPVDLHLTDCRFTLVNIPRDRFEDALADSGEVHGCIRREEAATSMNTLLAAMADGSGDEADIGDLQTALARLTDCRHEIDKRTRVRVPESLRCAIHRRLDDPDLSSAGLAKELGMSRATLYRMMAGSGGVAAFVRRVRLEEAFRLIMTDRGKSISDIAQDVGFTNFGHFSTSFRAAFDMRPRDARGIAPQHLEAASRVKRWLELAP